MHDPVMGDKYTPAVGNDGNFIANVNDDDGEILDSLVSSEAEPPKPDELPIVRIDMRPVPTKAIPSLVIARTRTINALPDTAYLIGLANPWRKRIVIRIAAPATVLIAGTSTEVESSVTSALFGSTEEISLTVTGELWCKIISEDATTIGIIEEITQEAGR